MTPPFGNVIIAKQRHTALKSSKLKDPNSLFPLFKIKFISQIPEDSVLKN